MGIKLGHDAPSHYDYDMTLSQTISEHTEIVPVAFVSLESKQCAMEVNRQSSDEILDSTERGGRVSDVVKAKDAKPSHPCHRSGWIPPVYEIRGKVTSPWQMSLTGRCD